jgi:hypothetical protein
MAFMTVITDRYNKPELNFANIGNTCSKFAGTSTLNCPQIA